MEKIIKILVEVGEFGRGRSDNGGSVQTRAMGREGSGDKHVRGTSSYVGKSEIKVEVLIHLIFGHGLELKLV